MTRVRRRAIGARTESDNALKVRRPFNARRSSSVGSNLYESGNVHPAAVVASSVLAAAAAPVHSAPPYMPAAPNVRYAHTAPPVNGTDNQLPAAAAYYPDQDTVYFGGNLDRFSRGHELGHAFDDQVLTDGDRANLMRLMGMTGAWNQGTGFAGGVQSPAEIFADWYGNAAIGNDPRRAWSDAYASAPTPAQFRRFQLALARIGRQRSLPQYTSKP